MKAGWLARWLVKNPGWRLLSLVLAVIIYMNVATEPEMSTLVTVPIQFKDPPENIEVITRSSETVQLETRGSSGQLRDLAVSKPAVTLDFSGIREPCDRTFTISRAQVNLPRGVELLRVSPSQLRYHFERTARKQVPATVQFEGTPPNGLHMAGFHVEPETLEIAGPDSHVDRVRTVLTEKLDLSAVDPKKPSAVVDVYLPDQQVRFVSQPSVTVTMDLK